MKQSIFTLIAVMMLTSSANAGGMPFSLPNLEYPKPETVTVGRDCVLPDAQSGLCTADQ